MARKVKRASRFIFSSLSECIHPPEEIKEKEYEMFKDYHVEDADIDKDTIIKAEDLIINYETTVGRVRASEHVSFELRRNSILGLVGESGCGKTTTAYGLLKLLPPEGKYRGGRIIYNLGARYGEVFPIDLVKVPDELMRYLRRKRVSIVFQGAMNAFNPVMTVGDQIVEAIMIHCPGIPEEEARKRVEELYKLVGLDPERAKNYPHEYSGGMKQRAMIAMALALDPDFIIADEPTTALDVTIQAQILELMKRLIREGRINSMILITHDLAVVAEVVDEVAVMYAGNLVEKADVNTIFKNPLHPYTYLLIKSIPSAKARFSGEKLVSIPGAPPSLVHPPTGCRFHPRCPYARQICTTQEPTRTEIEPNHRVACHYAGKIARK